MTNSSPSQTKLYAIFHLNLAFSSIPEEAHSTVIARCYWPLLNIIEKTGIPLGIELTAYTLEKIEKTDSAWVDKFKQLLAEKKCELLASGDSQIIGPLVPAEVNVKNLQLGLLSYETRLGFRPSIAYVNEQACSSGLLDTYLDCDINTVVIEWNNPFSFHPEWQPNDLNQPRCLLTAKGNTINVIWNNAIAFQKFQRLAHGELIAEDYLQWLGQAAGNGCQTFCIYGSDTEVFDFRPGRYHTELPNNTAEWERVETLLIALKQEYSWASPGQTLAYQRRDPALKINIPSHPVSVKKQAKYNVTRWGLSGRNDLLLNTLCYRELRRLKQTPNAENQQWRNLCRLWASDLRTHLCQQRYQCLEGRIQTQSIESTLPPVYPVSDSPKVQLDTTRNRLHVRTENITAAFNVNRGLTIESLAFKQHAFKPACGTLSHGHFDHISYGVDFYSNHLVMERFKQRDRVTDLSKVQFHASESDNQLWLYAAVQTDFGLINKWYRFYDDNLEAGFWFDTEVRPEASLRLGYLTLLNCRERAWYACHNGGTAREVFYPDVDFDHGSPVSSIVSASNALGATEGEVHVGNNDVAIRVRWNPAECAALPMLSSKNINGTYLNRLWFSLVESDETLQPGGYLLPFRYTLSPGSPPNTGEFG